MGKKSKAINTKYKGYNFRSRLEARWAVFFENLEIPWRYEPEGFELPNGNYYLPDFHLSEIDIWLEIKPVKKSVDLRPTHPVFNFSQEKIPFNDFYVLKGRPYLNYSGSGSNIWMRPSSKQGYKAWPSFDTGYFFCECPKCGRIGIEFEGRANRLTCDCLDIEEECHNPTSSRLLKAYKAASEARFEHKGKDQYAISN